MRRFCLTQLLVLAVIFCSLQWANGATLLAEGFDDITTLPGDGWDQVNNSDPLGLTDWFQGDDTLFPAQAGALPDSYIAANFDNTSDTVPGTISNWLISPEIDFAATGQVSFWTRTVDPLPPPDPTYPDRLQVRLSTAGASGDVGTAAEDVGDFTTLLLDINPTLTVVDYPVVWTRYVISSASLPASGTGRIAFRYYVTDAGNVGTNSDYIGIDSVEVLSKTYTLTYSAGANGSITGTSPQTVEQGADGSTVTAVADPGYHFVGWSDGSTVNPRTDTNVMANISVTAFFALDAATVLLSQGFDDITTLPGDGWDQVNNSDPLGLTDWFQGDDTLFPAQAGALPDSYIAANFDNTSDTVPGTISNWLISPEIDFAATGQVSFWTRTVDPLPPPDPTYPDRLQVRLSTAGASGDVGTAAEDVGDFTTLLLDINPTLTVVDYPVVWTRYVISSASLPASGTGRIAFRYYVTDAGNVGTNSDYIGIDTFETFARSYTLTYVAGANGSISGPTPQTVDQGTDGASVTAVPDTGYHFVNWSDGSTANPRTDTNVMADLFVTANFAINTYTLTYLAGANGTISGTTPQTVNHGASGTEVTAVPNTGYHFVNWSDGSTANPRTDSNVTADITVTANFAINTYTLTYLAGANGTISGTTPQTVNHGSSGTAVTPVPNTGYHFVNWSDGSTANPRTDSNVTGNITVTANFAINTYTLTYLAGANGTITGTTPQTVNHGASGTAVTPVPATGYHFVDWSDGSTANPRTDSNVTGNITVTANFAINTYTLTYNAGANGTISGTTPQTVNHGSSGTAVTPVPNTGYHFVNWSDGSTANPRTDNNVTGNITVTANFAINTYTLTYLAGANGTITGTTPQTVNHGASGTPVAAVANTGYHFVDWSDGSTANPRTDTNVTGDITVTANFAIDTPTLTVQAVGKGRVTSDPAGIDCQGDCTEDYDYGTVVTLTATPEPGTKFRGWEGDCTGTDTTCTVTMDQARNVTARFGAFPWNLYLPAILNPAPAPPAGR